MQWKAPLFTQPHPEKFNLSVKNFYFSKQKTSELFAFNCLFKQYFFPQFPSFLSFFVGLMIFAVNSSSLASVYPNCKANHSINDDLCHNFKESTFFSENTFGNYTVSKNTEKTVFASQLNHQVPDNNLDEVPLKKDSDSADFLGENNFSPRGNLTQVLSQNNRIDASDNLSNNNKSDPELGDLLLQEIQPTITSQEEKPLFYLIGNFGYMRSNNIFSGINPVEDNLFRMGVSLLTIPALSDQTSLIASVGGSFTSYLDQSLFDYDQLNLNVGVIHQFNDNFSGQFGWKNRQLFDGNIGDRFLNDHSLYLGVNYQQSLTEELSLNTGYQLQSNFSDPDSRSQVINSFNVGVSYSINPELKAGLNYQLALSNFTVQDRSDTYHELMGTLRYSFSPNASLDVFLGHSFGDSSNTFIDYDGLIFGVGFNVYLF